MGSGKTSAAIQMMNDDEENNYIFITPYLAEIDRIKKACSNKKFFDPINKGEGKLDSLHYLLQHNKNIASTHALFQKSTNVTKELISSGNYILILDEVFNIIEELKLQKDDLPTLFNEKLVYEENGFLLWNPERFDYQGEYNYIKNMAMNRNLMVYENTVLMWVFPVEVFKSFKEVYIMTYLFDAQEQKYYYDMHNLNYTYYYATKINDQYVFKLKETSYNENEFKSKIRQLININTDEKLNKIGSGKYSLSVTWFDTKENKPLIKKLQKNIYNFFRNVTKAKSEDIMWTTFKSSKSYLSGKGYTKGFIACNARATNEYKDRCILSYCCNIFLHPIIKNFFSTKNIKINEDKYALSQLLQWIWRSRIRENKEIEIFIPSSRMRQLLSNWLSQ